MSGCGLLKTKQPGSAAEGGYHVERTESEQGLLSIVLLVLLQRNCNPKTSQNLKMIYQPSLTIWVSQKLFPTSPRNGGFPKIKMQIAAL
ncbi:neuronal regeneration-related protein isoform X3 [Anas platyrhynchos]|uniref:neuronal regeneration-related protein isoform X3 n=1 Tax=Anas platyrhynchos TaxID=8839 RepID=UPI003AF1EE69